MPRPASWLRDSVFFRFLLSGGFNTLATYALYLALLPFLEYRVSYSIAYVSGIVLAYVLNRAFVFRADKGVRSALLFPLVYLVQYAAGIALVWLWASVLGGDARFAPLVAIAVTVPLTYLLSRYVFMGRQGKSG